MTLIVRNLLVETLVKRMAEERGLTPEELLNALVLEEAGLPIEDDNTENQARGLKLVDEPYEDMIQRIFKKADLKPFGPTKPLPKSFFDELSE